MERLVHVMKPEHVPAWMRERIPLLDHTTPLDVISHGGYRRVARVVTGLEQSGAI